MLKFLVPVEISDIDRWPEERSAPFKYNSNMNDKIQGVRNVVTFCAILHLN